MSTPFPLGLSPAAAFYLSLLVLTTVLHVLFMNYVLAGTGYLAWRCLGGRRDRAAEDPMGDSVALLLRDWMPFAISAAITAGVAPLLFLQVLYQAPFYRANLLLSHRWMAILPVLIVAFYLAYVLKAKGWWGRPTTARWFVGTLTFVALAFIAWSWTENHLLSMQPLSAQAAFYERQRWWHFEPALLPRLAVWFIGAWPTMAALVAWQLWWKGNPRSTPGTMPPPWPAAAATRAARRVAIMGIAGLGLAGLASVAYALVLGRDAALALVQGPAGPYAFIALAGAAVQVAGWLAVARRGAVTVPSLVAISAGLALTLTGATVVREAMRLSASDTTMLVERAAAAARVGGLVVFLIFTAANLAAVAWVVTLIRRHARPAAS